MRCLRCKSGRASSMRSTTVSLNVLRASTTEPTDGAIPVSFCSSAVRCASDHKPRPIVLPSARRCVLAPAVYMRCLSVASCADTPPVSSRASPLTCVSAPGIPCVDRVSQLSDPDGARIHGMPCQRQNCQILPDMTGGSQAVTYGKMRTRGKRDVFALRTHACGLASTEGKYCRATKGRYCRHSAVASERQNEKGRRCQREGKRERGSQGAERKREAAWGGGAVSFRRRTHLRPQGIAEDSRRI